MTYLAPDFLNFLSYSFSHMTATMADCFSTDNLTTFGNCMQSLDLLALGSQNITICKNITTSGRRAATCTEVCRLVEGVQFELITTHNIHN